MDHELTPEQRARIARINRYRLSRSQLKQKQRGTQRMLWLGLLVVVLILCAVGMAMALEWSPGNQEAIYAGYKARQHQAEGMVSR
jgi:hypothetical protein